MKTKRFDRVFVSALIAVGLLGGMGRFAFGQMQVQQNGSALDANPQVGSGGSNTPVPGYVPINGNDIVTGNVAGLKYFHGATSTVVPGPNGTSIVVTNPDSVGTFSPYVFQGSQGSASFNSFARQSAPTNYGNNFGQSYYLPSTTVSTGQGSLYSSPRGSGFDSSLAPSYSASPTSNVGNAPVSEGIAIRQYGASPANETPTTGGNAVLTSPLFGPRPQATPGEALSVSLTPTSPTDTGTASTSNQNGNGPGTNGNGANANSSDQNSAGNTPGNTTGNPLTPGNADSSTNGGTGAASGKTTNPPGAAQPRYNDTYRKLLQSLGQTNGQTGGEQTGNDTNGTSGNQPSTDGNRGAGNGDRGTPSDRTANRPGIDPLTGRPIIPGTLDQSGMPRESGTQSTDPSKPGYRPRSSIMKRSQLESIPDSTLEAGKKVEPLKTFSSLPAGGGGEPFDVLMKNAEGLLKDGKYLQAADAYQLALTTEPDNALAVIGRADAELGAGMYASAANDLKFLYAKEPALITVRHSLGDFIPVARQQFLEGDLKSLSTNAGPGNNASFMLTYLYYNTGRMDEVKAELGRWDNRAWKDEWEGVLRRAWGK